MGRFFAATLVYAKPEPNGKSGPHLQGLVIVRQAPFPVKGIGIKKEHYQCVKQRRRTGISQPTQIPVHVDMLRRPKKPPPPPPGSTRTGLRGICHPWHGITRVVAKLKTLRPTNYCGIYNLTEEHV